MAETSSAGTAAATVARGELFLISAPSGTGKSTLVRRVLADRRRRALGGELAFGASHTTRRPRRGEVDGREYHFVALEEFRRMRDADQFLEWAEVHGNLYGTSVDEVLPRLAAGIDVLHDLDVQGAERLLARLPEAHSIFVLPPSYAALRQRLAGRAQDDPRTVARRLAVSRWEIERYAMCSYVIINRDAELAATALAAIILDKRHRRERMDARVQEILRDFGAIASQPQTHDEPIQGGSH